jgi:hypothetical protein
VARGISFVFLFVAAVSPIAGACVGDDPDSTGSTPTADGGTSSSGGPSGTGLVDNGGFENGCPPSTSSAEITVETDTKRTGGKACKVCSKGTEAGYQLELTVDVPAKVGEVYRVSAWMRKAPSVEPGNGSLVSVIAIENSSPIEGEGAAGTGPLVTTDWKEGFAEWTVSRAGVSRVRIDVGHQGGTAGQCFLVDDVALVKTK